MPKPLPHPTILGRDGTSQQARVRPALDPGHVAVDERTLVDWLAFVRALARRLRFVDPERPTAALDWRAFLGDDVDLARVAAYVADPSSVSQAEAERFGRPHFALLLVFLRLLGQAQDLVNSLTRRHLEFYYEQVLRARRLPATPDQVNLVLRPGTGVPALLVPAGTELLAGKSSSGAPLVYRTDRDVLVTRAEVAELRSLYIDQRVTGVREANERRDPGTDRSDRFYRMFTVALGDPLPGDPLPPWHGQPVTLQAIASAGELARFGPRRLAMELYELRALVELKQRRDAAGEEWQAINDALQAAGRRRTGDPQWQLAPEHPRRFADNLARALDGPADAAFFAGLPEVDSIDDLYSQRLLELHDPPPGGEETDVAAFIRERLFLTLPEFDAMMALKARDDREWREVNRLLERAGQRRRGDRAYRLEPADAADFAANFAAALGPDVSWPPGVADLDGYHAAVRDLEAYFHMSAESLAYITAAAPGAGGPEPTPKQWDRIYAMLTAAYQAKVYAGRRRALAAVRAESGLRGMLYAALGAEPSAGAESPLALLRPYIARAVDYAYLQEVEARVAEADEAAIDAATWARVEAIVELAQRARERLPEPIPRRTEWRNLYPYSDATRVVVTSGLASTGEQPRWQTFGARPSGQVDAPPATGLGWAVASPLLALAEGERTVVLTLGFDAAGFREAAIADALARDAFVVEATTADGWIRPTSVELDTGDYAALAGVERPIQAPLRAIRLTLRFGADLGPLAALAPDEAGIAAAEPALRLSLRQIWDPEAGQHITLYEPFRPLTLAAVHLQARVVGLRALTLHNDRGPVDPRRPFEPFGPAPAVGARLLVGHPELVRGRLDALAFHLEWMGAPADLGAHYANYGLDSPGNASFTARISAVDRRRSFELLAAAPLLAGDARLPHAIAVSELPDVLAEPAAAPSARADLLDWPRYFQWELDPLDFQHGAYARVANSKAVALAAALAAGQAVDPADYHVAPPYTPKLKRLSVDYTAHVELLPGEGGRERLFHVRPFGSHVIAPEEGEAAYRFLPAYADGGELYIGLRDALASQQLALLIQVAEGSADPDLEPAAIEWSYLSGDRWLSLHDGDVLRDTTRGLRNTGILELNLPAAAPSTQLPPGLYWLRAAIARAPDSVCDIVAIRAQAVSATYVDRGDAPGHYDQPLPAGTIKGPVRADPRLGGVEQPFTSSGGRPPEQVGAFYTRVAERLRHKQRALTLWDYERLVLERFPQIYKVKCLPADLSEHPDEPGRVELIVIPDVRDKLPFDPFEPKAPADLLAAVEAHVAALCPPFATVKAKNPRYVAVKARFGVRFKPGRDPGFYSKRLGEELCRFLSPWAYEDGADIAIGGRIYANSVVNFVDQRDYVDHVATIKLFRSFDGQRFELVPAPEGEGDGGYFVATERPDEVLVAAREHDIDLITEVDHDTDLLSGINYMKVELDLVVG